MEERLTFSEALCAVKSGEKIARLGWNGKNIHVQMQVVGPNSDMTQSYLYIEYPVGHPANPDGCKTPWLASQGDLMEDDWIVID